MGIHFAQTLEPADVHLGVGVVRAKLGGNLIPLVVGIGNLGGSAPGQLVQRRHSGIDVAVLNQRPHIPEEEGQKQCSDMSAVHIRIGHDDHLVIAQLLQIKFVSDARAQSHDQGVQLVVAVDLVGSGLFHVEHLAPHGQNRLEPGVSALNGRAGSGVALHDVDFAQLRIALIAVLKLVRHLTGFQTGFPADGFSGLPGGFSGPVCHHGLVQHRLGDLGVLLKEGGQLVVHHLVNQGADIGVAQLGLGLTLELGVRQLHGDDGGDALPAVVAGDLVVAFDDAVFHAIVVEHPGQSRLEAGFVHTAFGSTHVVGKGQHKFIVAVVVLDGDFRGGVALAALHVDHFVMEDGLVPVAPGGEFLDAALVAHGFGNLLFVVPVVGDGDCQTGVQEGLLPHPLMKNLIVVDQGIEHLRVGLEGDLGAGFVGFAHHLHFLGDVAPGKFHFVNFPVFVHPHPQPLGQRVDNRRAYAVEAAGDLVAAAAEFAAGVEHGVHHFQGRPSGLGLDVHGDTPAVVGDGDGIAGIDGDGDVLAVAGQSLVDGVVHDLIDQVVQARGGGRADIHTRPLAHRLQTLQNLNLRAAVFLCYFRFVRHCCPPNVGFCILPHSI